MTKHFLLIFFLKCLIIPNCLAQGLNEVLAGSNSKPTKENNTSIDKKSTTTLRPAIKDLITVHFTSNENCSLKINGQEKGEINKNSERILKLASGNYNVRFVNKLTGKTLDSSLQVTPALVKKGFYNYAVAFKKEVVAPEKTIKKDQTVGVVVVTTPKNEIDPVPKPEVRRSIELATVNELLNNMVTIPGGSFTMGVAGGKLKELLPHTVTVNAIKFGKYEVTQLQWEVIMGTANDNSANKACSSCPVENVSWNEVDSFILKINAVGKNKFRLPTEAEWEYVAKKILANEMETPEKAGKKVEEVLEQTAWYRKNAGEKTHPTGTKKSLSGIHDLLGNVAEWCQDYYVADYQKDNPYNPSGPQAGNERVVKGGSFNDIDDLKPAVRNKEMPAARKKTIGFRLVLETN